MPSGETYVFEEGTLTEIKEAVEEESDNEEVEALKQENEQLKAKNKKIIYLNLQRS